MIDFNALHRIVTAAVGALVISSACIAAAVAPATSPGQVAGAVSFADQAQA